MNDTSLLDRCCEGDEGAWRELFERHANAVYRWAIFFGADAASAEEMTQEVFVRAFRGISKVHSERQLAPWLFQITRRRAANARRLSWAKRVFLSGGARSSAGEDFFGEDGRCAEEHGDVRAALAKMPLPLVEVLVLHDLEGRSRREISLALGLAEGTVAGRLAAARARFTALWEAE